MKDMPAITKEERFKAAAESVLLMGAKILELRKALTAVEKERDELRRALYLIEHQDESCGGNLRPYEIYMAMQRIARAALKGRE